MASGGGGRVSLSTHHSNTEARVDLERLSTVLGKEQGRDTDQDIAKTVEAWPGSNQPCPLKQKSQSHQERSLAATSDGLQLPALDSCCPMWQGISICPGHHPKCPPSILRDRPVWVQRSSLEKVLFIFVSEDMRPVDYQEL